MANYTFDILEASKRLREAGMTEGVAEAVVAVFQHATTALDLSHLATKADMADFGRAMKAELADLRRDMATKADIADMATKADIASMATKADIADMATKADIANMATKADIADMATRSDLFALEVRMSERMRLQGWSIMGGITLLLGLFTLAGKVIG